ncbi:peptidyl-tRNA hydrolase [Arsenicicoccus dermatophilus]|uniref:peptidyl-tRNA hydrolase n=1 Tax=Arsenicicoccus dermatophilus TaxID=1076331 RepID=UPI0039175116
MTAATDSGEPAPDVPWAMQLVVRHDKQALPDADLVCATAARAVVTLLADPRSSSGEWAAPVTRWQAGRIRKLVRRARGTRWDRVQAVPGVTVEEGRAAVRACVPGPARPLPPELDALQVSGTSFPPQKPREGDAGIAGPSAPVVTLATSPYADMTTGKAAAQCGHGAQLAHETLRSAPELAGVLQAWAADGHRVRVTHPDEAGWARLAGAPVSVTDAGLTELDGPTETIRAWWS